MKRIAISLFVMAITLFVMWFMYLVFAYFQHIGETDALSPEISVLDIESQENTDISNKIQNENIYVITDPDTGVQYLVFREKKFNAGMGGITPRLNPDGSLCAVDVEQN